MKLRKLISILLCAVMLAALSGTGAYAAEKKPFYLVLGDSIGYGSGLINSKEAVYGKIVADTNGYDYANDAIPGHTTKALLGRLGEESVAGHVKQADIISISIGGNNFLLGNILQLLFDLIVRNDLTLANEIIDGFRTDYDTIIETIHSMNPDAVILMQTLYNPQTGTVGEAYQVSLDMLNDAIKEYAEENPGEIEIVDVASKLTADDIARDGIHPSVSGNEKIAVAVLEKLKELGLGEKTEPVIVTKGMDIITGGVFNYPLRIYGGILEFLSFFTQLFASKIFDLIKPAPPLPLSII